MRHVGKAGDQNHAVQRIKVPRYAANQRLGPERKKSHRADGDHVAERQHYGREENRHQQPRLEKFFSRKIRAHKQKSQEAPERDRDQRHAERNQKRGAEGGVKTGIGENVLIGAKTRTGSGAEERFAKKALINDQPQRSKHHQGDADDRERTESPTHVFIVSALPSTVS